MTLNIVDREEQWVSVLECVKRFVQQHGRHPRSTCENADEFFLGMWCVRQRRKYLAGELSPERTKLAIANGILLPGNEQEFLEKLKACETFIELHGRTPSTTATDPLEKSLYYWRAGQQHLHSIGKLKPHRLRMLIDRGIFRTAYEYEWMSFFERLKKFIDVNGRPPVRFTTDSDEAQLGQWRQQQLALYKKGELGEQRTQLLESLGVATTVTNINWNNNFRMLQSFFKKHNSLPSRTSNDQAQRQLARWLETQRQLIKEDSLPLRRKKLIGSLGMSENRLEIRWDKTLTEVQAFLKKNGHLPSANSDRNKERSLGVWCNRQRTEHNAGRLRLDRLEHIKSIGLLLDQKQELWKKLYKQVYQYVRKYGELPKHDTFDPVERPLGCWCERQRNLYNQGRQPKDKITLLRTAGIIH
jgi:hypothetical protein